MSAEAIAALYDRHAAAWLAARAAGGGHEAPWLTRLLALMPPSARVLDLGCGGGHPVGRALLDAGCAITGVDIAPRLVAHASAALPSGRWLVGDMRTVELGERFDGVIAWDSLFHLTEDDQRAALARILAHLDDRAALLFTAGPHAGVAIGCWRGEPLFHASLDPDEYRSILAAQGLRVAVYAPEDVSSGRRTVWLALR